MNEFNKKRAAILFVRKYINEGKLAAATALVSYGVDVDMAKELAPYIEEEFNRNGYYYPADAS